MALAAGFIAQRPAPLPPETRLDVVTPPSMEFSSFAISPDGRSVVYQATVDGRTQLWLRPLTADTAQPVPSSENGTFPFWSPDSAAIAFFAEGQLKRFNVGTTAVQTIADAPSGVGGAWNRDGTVLFNRLWGGPLYRVNAEGGTPTPVTQVVPQRQVNHAFPLLLPDGRHYLFFAFGVPEAKGIYLGSLDSSETRLLVRTEVPAAFAPPDRILIVRDGSLVAQRIDPTTFELAGTPQLVAPRVAIQATNATAAVSGSWGPIAYRVSGPRKQLRWRDRAGRVLGNVGGIDSDQPAGLQLSRDRTRLAMFRTNREGMHVWAMDLDRGALRRITSGDVWACCAAWSPDGTRLVFSTSRRGVLDISEVSLDRPGSETDVLVTSTWKNVTDVSPDGRTILFSQIDRDRANTTRNAYDVWALTRGTAKPYAVVQGDYDEAWAQFAPDGQRIAYFSNESGAYDVYVQRFPGPGGRVRVSTTGATVWSTPQWRQDGRELFYVASDNRLMAVPIASGTGQPGTPVPLFLLPPLSEFVPWPDGSRFLVNEVVEQVSPITVLMNWAGRNN